MHSFGPDEIIVLLGAGASKDAEIPHSADMIKKVEELINSEDRNWNCFRDLYNYIRSSIYYSDGISGKFDNNVNYNIERLVNTLDELRRKEEHPLYPFIGSWNPRLIEITGRDFELLGKFKDAIITKLREWVALRHEDIADYYLGLVNFKNEYQHPLRIFTLNYDLCVERVCKTAIIERGFDENKKWNWRRFSHNENDPKDMFLYKLHGSTNWQKDENGELTYASPESVAKPEIIFGTTYKLQYLDPFLFFAYQFRQWSLEAKVIISIGYGYGDEHINGMIRQALDANQQHFLLSVSPLFSNEGKKENEAKTKEEIEILERDKQKQIAQILDNKDLGQIIPVDSYASDFMKNNLRLNYIRKKLDLKDEEDIFPIVINQQQ